ncbi:MAG: hypothetical protein KZQ64_07435 [gamma proteobacterium symbiont of Bathyaustriella thionipta]|nr:hypothetical protein [gamma proteobacterium symbiont of Bathyaustriella thionipta]MCU7948907.1 hypothetical protein [gamma proteobacterium symbiont of Bathyaustriella thionipta]MCU7953203.1 hypothetical protein [gamma proteobacterium symbiont of Bathyaustriella thionipta]MCU7955481.1 hypothetical protein [gamma proteobacterium symbiont of Bathyaustriella thionipta]MCU7965688.1 hypothetical protein [gamma proteobacterium symbiont of Bathyaustriella thionipta]
MMTHILSLIALIVLCVLWIVFQQWLAKQDPKYKGYQAGCGGCSRSCGDSDKTSKQSQKQDSHCSDFEAKGKKIHFVDASTLWSKYTKH